MTTSSSRIRGTAMPAGSRQDVPSSLNLYDPADGVTWRRLDDTRDVRHLDLPPVPPVDITRL